MNKFLSILLVLFLLTTNHVMSEENIMILKLKDGDVKIELFDLQGRRVYRSTHTTSQSLFDEPIVTGKLANGIYVLNVSQGNKNTTRRIILSK